MSTESLYSKAILSKPTSIPFHLVGSNIRDVLQNKLSQSMEGKCIKEGYIRPNSISIITYSSGMCKQQNIIYQVTFSCVVCYPVEGMKIRIKITKASALSLPAQAPQPLDASALASASGKARWLSCACLLLLEFFLNDFTLKVARPMLFGCLLPILWSFRLKRLLAEPAAWSLGCFASQRRAL